MDLSRSEILLGKEGIDRIRAASVCIFGVGGVGSYAAEAIARSGVGEITLVDFDIISPSNVNRQIPATSKTIGEKKAEVMAKRILDINPEVQIQVLDAFCTPENASELVPRSCDFVIDAVDTVSAKLEIVSRADKYSIPVISAMGAGNKKDPTMFEVADINDTSVCPLARVIRRELKARGINKLKVVYSKEPAVKSSITDEVTKKSVPASLSFVPSVMGLIMAGEIIKELIE